MRQGRRHLAFPMLAGKLGRAGGPSSRRYAKPRGEEGAEQISTAGTCPLNLLRNRHQKHERPTPPSVRGERGALGCRYPSGEPARRLALPQPRRPQRGPARARAFRARIFFTGCRGRSRPLGRGSGKSWGQSPDAQAGRPSPGQALGKPGTFRVKVLRVGPAKDGDATALPGAAALNVGAHPASDP